MPQPDFVPNRRPLATAACAALAFMLAAGTPYFVVAGEDTTTETYPEATQTMDEAISANELLANVAWLADDARLGRGLFNEGLTAAGDFIAAHFARIGLEPLTGEGFEGYFQNFDLPYGKDLVEDKTMLAVADGLPLKAGVEFVPQGWSAAGEFSGDLVFAGYGITSEDADYDDYADLDVEGKVVMVLRSEPKDKDGNSLITGAERRSPNSTDFIKARVAQNAGAAGLIIVNTMPEKNGADEVSPFRSSRRSRSEIPVIQVTRNAAQAMLKEAGLGSLTALQTRIDRQGKPNSKVSKAGKEVAVSGSWEGAERIFKARNIVGMVPGKNRDEYIVVGAHYDHVGNGEYGSGSPGEIHNGADDNASGTSTVMELAETIAMQAKNGNPPERSVIFALFTAEEIGLIGSRHLAQNLPIPAEEVVAMLNLDMVGRVRENSISVGGMETAAAFEGWVTEIDKDSPLITTKMSSEFDSRSDHASFIREKIPALFLFSGLHDEYHGPKDDVELINAEGMADVADFSLNLLARMTTASREDLAFRDPRQANEGATADTSNRPRFGIIPDFEADSDKGLVLAGISDDTPASKAGLKAGDILVRLNDKPATDLAGLRDVLNEVKDGETVDAVILRDGKEMTLKVTFGE